MYGKINIPLSLLSLLAIRAVIFGASIGDALVIIALSAIYGLMLYQTDKEQKPVNQDLYDEVKDLKSSINALKIAKTYGKI